MKLQEFIKKELELQDDRPDEAIEILSEKEIELNHAISQIQQLKSKYQKQIVSNHFEKWENSLKNDFLSFAIIGDKFKFDQNCINVGVKFSIEDKEFVAVIECDDCNKPSIYFGIGRHFVGINKHKTSKLLQKILNDNDLQDPGNYWYGYKYTSIENAYKELKNLIEVIEKQIPNSNKAVMKQGGDSGNFNRCRPLRWPWLAVRFGLQKAAPIYKRGRSL